MECFEKTFIFAAAKTLVWQYIYSSLAQLVRASDC